MARFRKGQSGNPAGKPKGARHRTTIAVETLLDGEAEGLTRKAIEMALQGDAVALRICMDRICPVRKGRPVVFDMPDIAGSADVRGAAISLLQSVAGGKITPEEGAVAAPLVELVRRAIETDELAARLDALEQSLRDDGRQW